jgi:putative salt-induced outer membrane protein
MTQNSNKSALLALTIAAAFLPASAWAQATVKDDGQWRAALGAGLSLSSGNTKSTAINLTGDAVRATREDKWNFYGSGLYAKTNDVITGEQIRAGTRYDWNLDPSLFIFGGLDLEKDKIAELKFRSAWSGGLGYKIINTPETVFNVFGGLSYTSDRYDLPRLVDNEVRDKFSYASLLFGEESTHKLSETTSAKQRLAIYPNLKDKGEYRAQFDAGLAVAMTKTMNLNVGLGIRHNSAPGEGIKKTDTLLTTGIAVKFE